MAKTSIMLDNKESRKICGTRREEAIQSWRKFYSEDLHNYRVGQIKKDEAIWQENENAYNILSKNLQERAHFKGLGIGSRIILKRISENLRGVRG
jgi:hypothetical protein